MPYCIYFIFHQFIATLSAMNVCTYLESSSAFASSKKTTPFLYSNLYFLQTFIFNTKLSRLVQKFQHSTPYEAYKHGILKYYSRT